MPFAACIVADQCFRRRWPAKFFKGMVLRSLTFLLGSWWGIALTRTPSGRMPWFEIGLSNALVIVAVMISLMPTHVGVARPRGIVCRALGG